MFRTLIAAAVFVLTTSFVICTSYAQPVDGVWGSLLRNQNVLTWANLTPTSTPTDKLFPHGCAHVSVEGSLNEVAIEIQVGYADGSTLVMDSNLAPDGLTFSEFSTRWAFIKNLPDEVFLGIVYSSAPSGASTMDATVRVTPCHEI